MRKIEILFTKTNAANEIIFHNQTDKKIIVLQITNDNITELKNYYNELIKNNNINNFYDICDEIYDDIILMEYKNNYELVKLTSYKEG